MGPGPARPAALSAYALIAFKAKQLCRKPGFGRSDEEDLAQDLALSLLKKEGQYDPSRGASPDTFADRVVDSEAKMILRARRRLKRAAGFRALSLDAGTALVRGNPVPLTEVVDRDPRTGDPPPTPAGEAGAREEGDVLAAVLAALPPQLAAVAERLKGGSVASAARDLGVSRRQVYEAVGRIRRRLEDAGLGGA